VQGWVQVGCKVGCSSNKSAGAEWLKEVSKPERRGSSNGLPLLDCCLALQNPQLLSRTCKAL